MEKLLLAGVFCLLLTACGSSTDAGTSATPNVSAETTSAATSTPETEIATEANEAITFTVYSPNEFLDGFNETLVEIEERDSMNVLNVLIEANVLNKNVLINSMIIEGSQLRLDLNTAFYDQLVSLGSTGERYFMGSVVNTFLSAYSSERLEMVYITVNGEVLESGHVVYDFPMGFFE